MKIKRPIKITKKRKIRIKMGVGLKKIHYSETDSEQKFLIKIFGNFPVTASSTKLKQKPTQLLNETF